MKRHFSSARRNERGAALVLAIVFMLVIGAIAGVTLAGITTGLKNRNNLDAARDREYAADGAIEYAIANVRNAPGSGPALSSCPPPVTPTAGHTKFFYPYTVGGRAIRVNCVNVATLTFSGFLQRNVIFTACEDKGSDCDFASDNKTVIRAQVNYQALGPQASPIVTGTLVQSWSVNG